MEVKVYVMRHFMLLFESGKKHMAYRQLYRFLARAHVLIHITPLINYTRLIGNLGKIW